MVIENQIVEGCKRGKRKSYNELYSRYASTMLGVCLRYCNSKPEAEDVLQEGFIKIFKKINTFEGRGSIEGWMRRIMINTAINNYKANIKHYYHDDIDKNNNINSDDEISFIPEDEVSDDEIIKMVQELPTGYQLVFNLYVIDGMTHKEIANELDISINTSKSQLFKARKWLKKKLVSMGKEYSH